MTDERDKFPGRSDSAKSTAREVPLARPLSGGESAPKALRGQRLEPGFGAPERVRAEDVELAVLREVETRPKRLPLSEGASVPDAREAKGGTLLSVGAIDPRARTERSLETPRMFMTRAEAEAEVYFSPKPLPAATEHSTIETETVKIAESADPRRAVTQPRLRSPDERAVVPEATAESVVRSKDIDPQSLGPDAISTTPEPLVKMRDEPRRGRAPDTLDPQKVSTQPELPRLKRNSEAPTLRLSLSVPPAEIAAAAEPEPKRPQTWLWVAGAAALVALLLVWVVRSGSGQPRAENVAAAVGTPPEAPSAPSLQPSPRPAAPAPASRADTESAPAPAVSLAAPGSSPAPQRKPAARSSKADDKPAAAPARQAIY